MEDEKSRDLAALLLAHLTSADVKFADPNRDHQTPLHVACSLGAVQWVQLLLWVCCAWILAVRCLFAVFIT